MKYMFVYLFILIVAFGCSDKDDRLREFKQFQRHQKNNRSIRTIHDVVQIINSVNPSTKSSGVNISPLIAKNVSMTSIASNPNDTLLYIVEGGDKAMVISANVKCNPVIAMFDSPDISILHELANPSESNSGLLDFIEQAIIYNQKPDGFNVYCNTKSPLTITEEVKTKVPVEWQQLSPFNKFVPKGYAAGCVAIAVAQTFMVTRHVDSFKDIPLDYDRLIKLQNYSYERNFPSETNTIARFIHEIGKSVKMKYGKEGSSADLSDAIKLFTKMGNRMLVDNNPSNIRKTLKNYRNGIVLVDSRTKKPILGIIDQGAGHSYIADGYRIYSDGSDLIHINFGRGPGYNGYFLTKLTAPDFTPDTPLKYPHVWRFYCLSLNPQQFKKIFYRSFFM